ncbi:MAG: hypothetical protein U0840_00480 [Gemmataceae bacterium]
MLKHVLRKLLGTLWRSKLERACQGLGIERLEDRALLSVTASLDGTGRLALTPDTLNTNNTLAINRTGPTELMVSASETIQIGPVDAAVGSLAAVSGGVKVTLTDPARLTAIALSLRGGNDRIDFTSSSGAAPHLLPAIQIDVGNGSGLSGTVGLADVRNQAFVQVNLTTLQVAGGDAITLGSDLAADRSVALASQKSIDTQGHDLTATGAGSGIVFDSQAIRVTNGTALKASGDIVLRAQDALDTPFSIANPFFRDLGVQASVVVASGASLDGANIRISADSNSSKIMEFQANPLAPTTLLVPDANVGMDEAQKLTFSASARTITRTTGTWASDGFTPGMFISVQDSEKNSAAFKILSLNGLTMTLTTEAVLVDETATAARVVGMKVELDETGSPLTVDKVAQQFARSASLLNKLPGLKVVDQNIPFASLQAEAVSSIDVGAGANLRATGDVFLSTLARNNASFENSNRILGFTYASAKASATTTVAGQINAGGIVEVAASVRNRLKVGTKTESDDANAIGVSFTFGDGESTTQAVLADGGRIEAGKAVRLLAGNINEFEVSAGSKGDRGSGLGIAVADVDSTSTASVRGQIKTAGTVDVHAQSINLANDVKAEAVASSAQTTAQSALKKLKETSVGEKLFNLPLIGEKLQKAETTATPTESGASAALVISLSDNLARAEVVPATGITTNQVDAGGSVRITSTAINNYQNSAVGSAKGSTTYAVGGAVVLADHTNKAFATIDAGASVTTGREVVIDATALIPNQIDLKTDLAALKNIAEDLFANPNQGSIANDPDASSSGYTNGLTARISENVTAAKALAAMADYFSPDKLVGGKVASTFAGANAKLQTEAEAEQGAQQGKVAGSGSFTYVNVENLSDASIGAGAVVTTGANLSNTPVSLSNAASIQVGDTVVYHKGTGAAPLTDGKAYTLASRATGKLYFAESQPVYFDPRLQVNRGLQANTLTLDGFENGTPVLYRAGGGKPIAGLVDGKVYYVIVVGKNAIQLATTAENARNRRQIQINGQDVTSGGHSLTKVIEVATTTPGTLSLEAVRVASNASVDTIDVEGLGPLAPTSGGAYSIGGSLLVSRMQNRSLAHIEDAAQVTTRGGDVSVVADSVHRAWHVVLSGGAGGKYAVNGAIGIHLGSNETLAYVEDTATVNSAGKVRVLANADVKSIEVEGALNTSANAIGITAGIYSTDVTTRAFVGPRSGAASATGTVTTGSDLVVRAVSDQRLYSFAIAGALAKNQTPGAPAITDSLKELITGSGDTVKDSSTSFLDRVKALRAARSATPVTENAGLGLSGAVTFVESDNTVEAFVSTATVTVGGDLTVEARGNQTALAVAGAGALSTGAGSSKGISGSAAIGLLDQDVNAQVSSATVRSRSLTVNAVATQKVQDIAAGAAGGLGTTGGLAVAGSASINLLNNEANADLGLPGQPTQVTTTGGGVDVTASATLELLAVGGGLAVSSGKGAGAGFVVGFHDNAARARIADNSRVTSQGPVGVRATTTEKVQSIAAQLTGTQQGFGVAGSMVLMVGSPTSLAEIGQAATVTITGSGAIVVRATDDATLTHVAGAASLSMTGSAIGGSVVVSILDREVTARVGSQAVLVGPGGITVEATSTDKVLNLAAAGGIGGGGLAIEGSVLLHVNDTDTMAEVGSQAQLTAASQSISILARQTTKGSGGAGALAVSRGGAVGASIDLEFHEGDTRASVGASARLDAGQQVMVQAFTTRTLTSVAAAASLGGGSFAGAGSYLGLALAQQTHATIGDSAVVQAGGNVLVTADSVTNLTSVAGSGGIGKTAGVAASIIVVATDDDVQASIGSGAQVDGKGNTAGSSVLTGQRNNNRDRLEQAVQGVAVVATSSQDYLNVAAGAGLGGSAGLAGSIIVLVPVDTTRSLIGADARINTLPGAGPNQGVYLLADDDTRQLDVAGAVAAGGSGGIGAGIDVTIANKTTEATIGDRANVKARQHIQTVALSDEDATIAAAALGVGGSAGLAGSFGISGQTLVTRAIIGPAATVSAEGNVVVSADDHFESDVGAGAGGVGGSAGFGASIDAAVIDKTVEALVQPGAIVVGKGTRGTSNVRTAAFHKGSNSGGEGEVAAPPLDPSGATRDADTDRKIAGRIAPPEGGLQVTFAAMKGVAVTATSVDDVEQITISGAVGGSVGLTVSGSFYGLAGTTRAADRVRGAGESGHHRSGRRAVGRGPGRVEPGAGDSGWLAGSGGIRWCWGWWFAHLRLEPHRSLDRHQRPGLRPARCPGRCQLDGLGARGLDRVWGRWRRGHRRRHRRADSGTGDGGRHRGRSRGLRGE